MSLKYRTGELLERWSRANQLLRNTKALWIAIAMLLAIVWCSVLIAKIIAGDIEIPFSSDAILKIWFAAVGVWFFRVLLSRRFTFTIQLVASLTIIVALSLSVPFVAMAILSVAIVLDLAIQRDRKKQIFAIARFLQIPAGVWMLAVVTYGFIYTYLI